MWSVLLVVLPALYQGDLAGRDLALTSWIAVHAVVLALCALGAAAVRDRTPANGTVAVTVTLAVLE